MILIQANIDTIEKDPDSMNLADDITVHASVKVRRLHCTLCCVSKRTYKRLQVGITMTSSSKQKGVTTIHVTICTFDNTAL